MNLEDVIDQILPRHSRDSGRLNPLADYLRRRMIDAGLPDMRGGSEAGELRITGLGRDKDWDLAYDFAGKPRLLVSLKSIWKNASGTVPNRIDDLMGEAANVQQMSPEVVVGYVVLFDIQADSRRKSDGLAWSEYFQRRIEAIAIRKAPLWNQGLLEGVLFVRFDSAAPKGSRVVDPEQTLRREWVFLISLLCELKLREPAIPMTRSLPCDQLDRRLPTVESLEETTSGRSEPSDEEA